MKLVKALNSKNKVWKYDNRCVYEVKDGKYLRICNLNGIYWAVYCGYPIYTNMVASASKLDTIREFLDEYNSEYELLERWYVNDKRSLDIDRPNYSFGNMEPIWSK